MFLTLEKNCPTLLFFFRYQNQLVTKGFHSPLQFKHLLKLTFSSSVQNLFTRQVCSKLLIWIFCLVIRQGLQYPLFVNFNCVGHSSVVCFC
ncbi:hypothetical protein QVD17_36465 [Tagetes erecta]|uniref:Uncharacterized protein n=1 Tax=Tagetes erecta TaxID=13708 RepID=A0AAD8JUX7_TARER|nr:hypothetical protein QVD17_36465 [Tagetes erecta]